MKIPPIACLLLLCLIVSCAPQPTNENASSSPRLQLQQDEKKIFDYEPRKPSNGTLTAAIEIGSLGLNYFIIDLDNQGSWELEEASYSRSNFIYGVNSNEEIVQTITGFIEEIISYGVSRENVHLIASSSVVNGENLDDLNALLGQKTQLNIVGISAENEAKYALAATVPQEFLEESFVVDIGSGNSKLSWVSNQDTLSIEIHGSKYFLSDIQDTTVFREVRDAVLQIPEENRNLCFMLGGLIYEFAKDKMLGSGCSQ